MKRKALAALVLFALFAGCNHGPRITDTVAKTTARSRQLSILAAREAGNIKDTDARLTRQLNIADQVLRRFTHADATEVLREVVKTLSERGGDLNGHARISGWVSVSQLSRQASDKGLAVDAITEAEKDLEAIDNPAERCQYVMGVAEELSQLKGESEAAALLIKGGQWVSAIGDRDERRMARRAFAVALFNLDNYDGAVATLRHEQDAIWSSDTMLQLAAPEMAEQARYAAAQERSTRDEYRGAPVAMEPEAQMLKSAGAPVRPAPAALENGRYGRRLGFADVFQGNQVSATARPAPVPAE